MTTEDKELLKLAQAYYNYVPHRERNFLFYCNPKAASSSLKYMLDIKNQDKWQQISWQQLPRFVGIDGGRQDKLDFFDKKQFFSFGFVRNPYDRVYSAYKMLMLFARELAANNPAPHSAWLIHWHKINSYKTFDEFVKKEIIEAGPADNHLRKQTDFLLFDRDPKIDFIGKFENFENDIVSLQKEVVAPILWENCKTVNLQSKEYARLIEKYDAPRFTKEMSYSTMKKIQEFYRDDFVSFRYDIEDFGEFKII